MDEITRLKQKIDWAELYPDNADYYAMRTACDAIGTKVRKLERHIAALEAKQDAGKALEEVS